MNFNNIIFSSNPLTSNLFLVQKQLITIILTTITVAIFCLYYFYKSKKLKPYQAPTGIVLVVEMSTLAVKNMILESLGKKFVKFTPFFMFFMFYILTGTFWSLIGFESPVTSYSVPLTMAIITFLGSIFFGLKYQKMNFIRKYTFNYKKIPIMINPLELFSLFTPLISLSFRMWGNITAGALILSIMYNGTANILSDVPVLKYVNVLGGMITPVFHLYFDGVGAVVQAYVFMLLTMMYWSSGEDTG